MKGVNIYAGVFKETFGLYSYKCLPMSDASKDLCHFIQQDTLANFLKSAPVRIWLSSGNDFASSATYFANSSAIQLPLISACPGVH